MLDAALAPEPIVEARNLTTRFDIKSGMFGRVTGRVHAVENISFQVNPNETLSLVGESGCGKSTTGRSLLKLTQPTSGQVIFDGKDITTARPAIRSRLGLSLKFQITAVLPELSTYDNILLALQAHRSIWGLLRSNSRRRAAPRCLPHLR